MLKNYFTLALFFIFISNIHSQTTTIPDANFEQALIDLNIDTDGTINQSIVTADVSSVLSIDIGYYNITDLTGIEDFTSLTTLICWANQLTSLDLSQNTALEYLSCQQNQLTSLNVNGASALIDIACNINLISNLDVSQNTALQVLSCGSNPLTSLNINGANNLTLLSCGFTQLTSLNVSQNTNLATLFCGDNPLTSLDVSQNVNLVSLWCNNNQLTSLNAKNGNNSLITTFNATNNTSLTCIDVDNEIDANTGTGSYSTWSKDATATYSEDCIALGLDDVLLAKSITLYPNPVSEILTIDSKIPLTKVEIYSLLGQKVKDINSGFNSISLYNLSKGIYIVRLQSENGFATKKLIKQ